MFKKIRQINYKHYICILITLLFLALAIFYFKYSHLRIIESIRDLGLSIAYYFLELLELDSSLINPTVNDFTNQKFMLPLNLPGEWNEFKELFIKYFEYVFTWDNFVNYLKFIGDFIYYTAKILTLLVPIILIMLLTSSSDKVNNDYNKDSKPLIFYKKIEDKIIWPVKKWIINFIQFIKENSIYIKIWIFIWMYSFCFFVIIIEFLAYYLYFIASFDLISIYRQVLKLIIDLAPMLNFIPTIVWIFLGLKIFHILRKKQGLKNCLHLELRNRGFINSISIIIMLIGTTGSKKTTMITDIALSKIVIFRDEALVRMYHLDLKFPNFTWIVFENELKLQMKKHKVYNLATCREFVAKKRKKFIKNPCNENLFEYDYEKYGYYYYGSLKVSDIWDILETYAQLYFIYVIESSLILSNYSIRTDGIMIDYGNLPLWDYDYFNKDPILSAAYTKYSHILNYDMFRLGKKMNEFNKFNNVFEFGVVVITEIGKERGNNLENQEIKKNEIDCNQKNDLFNWSLKIDRQGATVDNYPFLAFVTDDQRAASWGADARDLSELIEVESTKEEQLTMPFFEIEDLAIDFIANNKFMNKYLDHRNKRGDNTLFVYLYKNIVAKLQKYREDIYETFGYYELDLVVQKGTQESKPVNKTYYLQKKKIYSERFSTSCLGDFFHKRALSSKVGLADVPIYQGKKASINDMKSSNSFFYGTMIKHFVDTISTKKKKKTTNEHCDIYF